MTIADVAETGACGAVHPFRAGMVCDRPAGHERLHCNVTGGAFGYEWEGSEQCDCLLDPTMFHHRPSCSVAALDMPAEDKNLIMGDLDQLSAMCSAMEATSKEGRRPALEFLCARYWTAKSPPFRRKP